MVSMSDPKSILSPTEIDTQLPHDWKREGNTIHRQVETGDFTTGLRMLNQIGEAAETQDHHPDLFLTYGSVSITLYSHDVGGVTTRGIRTAETINGIITG